MRNVFVIAHFKMGFDMNATTCTRNDEIEQQQETRQVTNGTNSSLTTINTA